MKPLVKVCGMTGIEDAMLCEKLGASFLGFIFHEGSPRNVSVDFVAGVKTSAAVKVGVFVKQSSDEVMDIMQRGRLKLAQLHGGQGVDFCRAIGADRVIKVLWPQRYESVKEFQADIEKFQPHCRFLLFDAGKSGGGHGTSLDVDVFNKVEISGPWLLAGGLGPENIHEILSRVQPTGIDLNSGVESAPGIKDKNKLIKIFN